MSERAQILIRHGVDLKVFREEIMPAGELVLGPPSTERAQGIRAILPRSFSR